MGGRYDTSKLLKIGSSYRVTSSPKIASNMQGWPKGWYDRVKVALLLPLVRQKGDEWIPWKALTAMVWGVGGFCYVERAIFRILGLFWGMMSLGKNYLFLATLKCHSDPPTSPITVKPIFLRFRTQK